MNIQPCRPRWKGTMTDRERFVDYNLRDARLVTKILDELELVPLAEIGAVLATAIGSAETE